MRVSWSEAHPSKSVIRVAWSVREAWTSCSFESRVLNLVVMPSSSFPIAVRMLASVGCGLSASSELPQETLASEVGLLASSSSSAVKTALPSFLAACFRFAGFPLARCLPELLIIAC